MKEKLLRRSENLLAGKQTQKLRRLLLLHDPHVLAEVINEMHNGKRKLFTLLPPEVQAEVSTMLSSNSREIVLRTMPVIALARFMHFNHEDDATDLLQALTQTKRKAVLEKLQPAKRKKIEKLLRFGAETAGGIMDLNFFQVPLSEPTNSVHKQVREWMAKEKESPVVIATKENGEVAGYVPYRTLIFAKPSPKLFPLLHSIPLIPSDMDREQALNMILKMKSELGCVVNQQNQALGIIHLGDLLRIAQAEATEDIYNFAGVDREEDFFDSALTKVRRRHNWLIMNLATAFLASYVVAQFESTIGAVALLAVYMPIVAGQGGNAGTQALAVTVRGLTNGTISWDQARQVMTKEMLAGFLNGIIVGTLAGGISYFLHGDKWLSMVLAIAMIANLTIAGFVGALVPVTLRRLKIDPAIASSIFVTTVTDVFGFLVFLGLGSLVLLT